MTRILSSITFLTVTTGLVLALLLLARGTV
jgi:hypothetical protein